jgi:hypothetical protein
MSIIMQLLWIIFGVEMVSISMLIENEAG